MTRFDTDQEYRERAMAMYRAHADEVIRAFSAPDRDPNLMMRCDSRRLWNERLQAALREKGYDSDLVDDDGKLYIANVKRTDETGRVE